MKKLVITILLGVVVTAYAERFVVDRVEAVIFGDNKTVVVTKSDAKRTTLNGQQRTVEDVILEALMFQEAEKLKITPDETTVNRYLDEVERDNNLSANEIRSMFAAAGYTYAEGKEQLAISFAVNSLMDFKIRSRLVVSDRDIQAYYDEHPIELEPSYCLQQAVVPYVSVTDHAAQRADLERQIKTGKELKGVQWTAQFYVNKSDMDASKAFIFSMKPGTISMPHETTDGFELLKLVEAQPQRRQPLEERRAEIVEIIRKPRYEELLASYKKELYEASSIIHF
jgi:peptidyl-prolyl cis-trans isomerase SurA